MCFEDGYVSDVITVVISTRRNIADIILEQIFCSDFH